MRQGIIIFENVAVLSIIWVLMFLNLIEKKKDLCIRYTFRSGYCFVWVLSKSSTNVFLEGSAKKRCAFNFRNLQKAKATART